jgi:hypothetical protein
MMDLKPVPFPDCTSCKVPLPPIVRFGDDMHIILLVCDKIYRREGDMRGTLLYSITRSVFLTRPNLYERQHLIRSG